MSEIPFYFDLTPQFLRKHGYLKNPKNNAFVSWCFSECRNEPWIKEFKGKSYPLQPYQFIFTRSECCDGSGLTDGQVRNQQTYWESKGFLKRVNVKQPTKQPTDLQSMSGC